MKKIIALIMALALVMGLAITASAQTVDAGAGGLATITITNASRGETYSVYKVFGATVTGTENGSIAYTGTVPSELAGCFEADAAGYISKKDGVTDEVILGALKTWATTADEVTSAACTDGSALVFTGLEYGYYVVLSSQGKEGDAAHGAAITVTSTNPTATIVDKNSTSPANLEKKIDKANVNFGDTVTYTVTFKTSNFDGADIAAKRITKYTIEDTLPEFLSNVTVTSIKVDAQELDVQQFNSENKIDIAWVDASGASLYNNGATVTITYTATITEQAAIAGNGNENEVTLTWTKENDTDLGGGDGDFVKTAITSTYALALKKVNQSGANLAGATFQFPFYVKETTDTDGAYIYAGTDGGTGLTNTITTPASGEIVIKGVASGTYNVTETAAPTGYNKLTGDVAITVTKTEETTTSVTKYLDANGNVVDAQAENGATVTYTNDDLAASVQIVVNKTGSALPSTGGIGTTLFYVIGGLLMTGAAVLLITKKRMSN